MSHTQNHRTSKTAAVGGFLKAAGKATMNGLAAWGDAIIMNQMPEVGTIFRDRRGNAWICTAYDELRVSELRATNPQETLAENTFTWLQAYNQGLTQVWPIKPCAREHAEDIDAADILRPLFDDRGFTS